MKIAVVGGNGQLGAEVVRIFGENGDEVFSLTHADLEIADRESVSVALGHIRPDVVVNTAAMHHVENCEAHPAPAFDINALGARNLALVTRELGSVLMHVSTDYVFDGSNTRPYDEGSLPKPLNVYGNTKLAGEYFVRSTASRHFVLRTSGIYGKNPCRGKGGRNFVELMLKLATERGEVRVVANEFVTPTSATELARQMLALSRCESYGMYHASAEGECSWLDFAREIFAITNTPVTLKAAESNEFPAKVRRPTYSVLENRGLKLLGLNIFRPWQDGLRDYLSGRAVDMPEMRQ